MVKIMDKKELSELREVCIQLETIMQKHSGNYYKSQIKALYDIVNCIDSDDNEEKITKYIISRYKVLYPSHGGLNEFYIDNDDFEKRLKLNEPLDKLKERLWSFFKLYV